MKKLLFIFMLLAILVPTANNMSMISLSKTWSTIYDTPYTKHVLLAATCISLATLWSKWQESKRLQQRLEIHNEIQNRIVENYNLVIEKLEGKTDPPSNVLKRISNHFLGLPLHLYDQPQTFAICITTNLTTTTNTRTSDSIDLNKEGVDKFASLKNLSLGVAHFSNEDDNATSWVSVSSSIYSPRANMTDLYTLITISPRR